MSFLEKIGNWLTGSKNEVEPEQPEVIESLEVITVEPDIPVVEYGYKPPTKEDKEQALCQSVCDVFLDMKVKIKFNLSKTGISYATIPWMGQYLEISWYNTNSFRQLYIYPTSYKIDGLKIFDAALKRSNMTEDMEIEKFYQKL